MDNTFLQARIDATQAAIVAYEAAELALADGGIQEYLLDTGQSRQRVTKLDLTGIRKTIESLMNRLVILQARLNGGNTIIGKPGW